MALISHYRLNGDAKDSIGGHNGTPNNVSWVDGKLGGAGSFTNSTISIGTGNTFLPLPVFTISGWIKTPGLGEDMTMNGIISITYGLTVSLSSSGNLRLRLDDGSTLTQYGVSKNLHDNIFHHFAVGYDGTHLFMFIDGVLERRSAVVWHGVTRWMTNSAVIGHENNNGSVYRFNGLIDDVRIYDHALSKREVRDLSQGLTLHYSFNDFQEPTENLLYTNGSINWTISNLGAAVSRLTVTENYVYRITSTTGGTFRISVPLEKLVNGSEYAMSYKYKVVSGGQSFYMTDWCDTSLYNRVDKTGYSSATGVRSEYSSIYRFMDFVISQDTVVEMWDFQLEEKSYATPFINGTRTGTVRDRSTQGNDSPLAVANTPKWTEDSKLGRGAYEFDDMQGITLPSHIGNNDEISVFGWFKQKGTPGSEYHIVFGGAEVEVSIHASGLLRCGLHINGTRRVDNHGSGLVDGNWHLVGMTYDGTSKVGYIDGVEVGRTNYTGTIKSNFASRTVGIYGTHASYHTNGSLDDIRIYATALAADEVGELYQQRGSLDNRGNFYAPFLTDTGIKQRLHLNYTQWEDGQIGSIGMFDSIGATTENHRIISTDPWGKETVAWECRPDAVSGPDGGWNSVYFTTDTSKCYRLCVWVRRTVAGNGSFYIGTAGSGSSVLQRDNGNANGNPYFHIQGSMGADWMLVVGHIWPVGSGTGADHIDSGLYRVGRGRVGNLNRRDFVFAENTTSFRHRAYLYYSTDTTTRQQFVYPRVDKCDGTEPSITELLAGFDSRNEALLREQNGEVPGFSIRGQTMGNFSEVAPVRDIAAWYPLQGNTTDLVGSIVGVNNGGVATADGYSFDGASHIRSNSPLNPTSSTISAWVLKRRHSVNSYPIFVSFNLPYIASDSSIRGFRASYNSGGAQVHVEGTKTIPVLNQWYHVAVTFDDDGVRLYVNGEFEKYSSNIGENTGGDFSIGTHGTGTLYAIDGKVRDVRTFLTPLTAEEINILYEMTNPESTQKMKQTKDSVYIIGQFKEV